MSAQATAGSPSCRGRWHKVCSEPPTLDRGRLHQARRLGGRGKEALRPEGARQGSLLPGRGRVVNLEWPRPDE